MRTIQSVRNYIKGFEQLKLKAYLCPAGVWTIGFGATSWQDGSSIKEGQQITKNGAEELFNFHVNMFEIFLDTLIVYNPINDYRYSALISLIFNIGNGNFLKSKVYKYLKIKDYYNASISFMNHVYAYDRKKNQRVKLKGLVIRRTKEKEIFDTLINAAKIPEIKFNSINNLAVKGLMKIYDMKDNRIYMPKFINESELVKPLIKK
jgi:lysozyme